MKYALGSLLLALAVHVGCWIAGRSVVGDDDIAAAALEAGRAAMERSDWADAERQFERAMSERPDLWEAHRLHARCALAQGNEGTHRCRLRQLLQSLESRVPLQEEALEVYVEARSELCDASKEDAKLARLAQKEARSLARLARRWWKKDGAAAERAAIAALRLDPEEDVAADVLEKLHGALSGKTVSLVTPSMRDWTWVAPTSWQVRDGGILAEARSNAVVIRTNQKWRGDFDVVVEARLLDAYADEGPPHFAVLAPFVDKQRYTALGCLRGTIYWYASENDEPSGPPLLDKEYKVVQPGLTAESWVTYELRFRAHEMIALVNGVELARVPRPADLAEGYVALKIQCAKTAFRRVDVTFP